MLSSEKGVLVVVVDSLILVIDGWSLNSDQPCQMSSK